MEKVTFHPCIVKYIKFKNGQIGSAHFYPDEHGTLYTDFELCRKHSTIKGAVDAGWLCLKGEKFHIAAYTTNADGQICRATVVGNVNKQGTFKPTKFFGEFKGMAFPH